MAYVPTHWVAHPDSLAKTQEAAAAINKLEQAVADLSTTGGGGGGGGTAPDATTTTKGIVQLAGDLGGTAAAPTVPGLAGKADASHQHDASDVNAGTLAIARIPTGTTGSTVALGNHSHTPASIGAAPASHTHGASDLSGVVKTVNGEAPDGAGNVVVAGGSGVPVYTPTTWDLPGLPRTGSASESTEANFIYLSPFQVMPQRVLDGVMCHVTDAHAAGAVARLGIYRWTTGQSWERVLDAGTVDISAVGVKTIVDLSLTLTPGLYALATVASSGTGKMGCWATSGGAYGTQGAHGITGNKFVYYGAAGTTAALPATLTGSGQGGFSISYTRGAVRFA